MTKERAGEQAKILTNRILSENGFVCQNTTGNPVEQLFNGVKAAYLAGATDKEALREVVEFTVQYFYGNRPEKVDKVFAAYLAKKGEG